MTPSEKNILRSLVAVAWADGRCERQEIAVIEGLLCGFDASETEERELLEYAKQRRTLEADIPLALLSRVDRELLLANAALLTHADGLQGAAENAVLQRLIVLLGIAPADAAEIVENAGHTARRIGWRRPGD